jgi:hypothetical protein
MESRAKLVGHAIHPTLIVFPLGLLGMPLIFLGTGTRDPETASFWMIDAGVIMGLLAAAFAFGTGWPYPVGRVPAGSGSLSGRPARRYCEETATASRRAA